MEEEILSLYAQVYSVDAFLQGINEDKNELFIPSKENKEKTIQKIDLLLKKCKEQKQILILESIKKELTYYEPQVLIDNIANALFFYTFKKISLNGFIEKVKRGIKTLIKEYTEISVGLKTITKIMIKDLIVGLKMVSKDEELLTLLNEYDKSLTLDFSLNEEDIISNLTKFAFKRKKFYSEILKDRYCILESPKEIETKCLTWLDETLPEFKEITNKIKQKYNLKTIEQIDELLLKQTKGTLLEIAEELRPEINNITKKELLNISSDHKVKLVITPPYLISSLPFAGANSVNILNGEFDNLLFITAEAKLDKYFMLDLLVHEEIGHNVNFSNSYKTNRLDKLLFIRPTAVTAEAIAVSAEVQFYELTKNKFGEEFRLFYDYTFFKRLVTIYLRAISDVRTNLETQSLKEFITWANKLTNLPTDFLFRSCFFRQLSPGYATSYPIAMHALEEIRKESKLTRKEFNTKAWSIGLPPFPMFIELLNQ